MAPAGLQATPADGRRDRRLEPALGREAPCDGALDALIAAEAAWLRTPGGVSALRPDGVALILAEGDDPRGVWDTLPSAVRERVEAGALRVGWVAPSDGAPYGLLGAALAAGDGELLARVTDALRQAGREHVADALQAGADGAGWLEAAPPARVEEVDFRPKSPLPLLPAAADDDPARDGWRTRLRRFHLDGASDADARRAARSAQRWSRRSWSGRSAIRSR